jgi:flagellin
MVSSTRTAISSGLSNLAKVAKESGKSFERLSSGKRLNKASDGPAEAAVVANLEASVKILGQATRNVGDTSAALQIADGATEQIQNLVVRQQELATQSANGSLSDEQRGALQAEYSSLSQEITRISETTQFNGKKLLSGETISAQVGTDASANSTITTQGINPAALSSAAASQNIGTQAGAQSAISALNDLSSTLSQQRGEAIGAVQSRLASAESSISTRRIAEEESRSRIADADVAEESLSLVRNQILAQTSASLVAQASRLDRNRIKELLG